MNRHKISIRNLRCLFIGPMRTHAVIGRIAAAISAGFDVYTLNVFDLDWRIRDLPFENCTHVGALTDPFYHMSQEDHRKKLLIEYLRSVGLIFEDRRLVKDLKNIIKKIQPHFAIVHYGPISIRYARILKRINAKLPIIDIVNLLPSYLEFLPRNRHLSDKKIEDTNYSKWLRRMDGVIFASQEMLNYAQRKFGLDGSRICILEDYLPQSFFYNGCENLDSLRNVKNIVGSVDPKIIYLGAPERRGYVIDDLDDEFMRLAKKRIHIYSATLSSRVVSTGFGHQYPLFTDQQVFSGVLARYASQFDAAISIYNTPKREERFRSTLPTRLFTSLTAGIPIVIKAGIFDACERFLKFNDIGFAYTNSEDLRDKLMDKSLMDKFRLNAKKRCKNFTAESQGEDLRKFAKQVCGLNGN